MSCSGQAAQEVGEVTVPRPFNVRVSLSVCSKPDGEALDVSDPEVLSTIEAAAAAIYQDPGLFAWSKDENHEHRVNMGFGTSRTKEMRCSKAYDPKFKLPAPGEIRDKGWSFQTEYVGPNTIDGRYFEDGKYQKEVCERVLAPRKDPYKLCEVTVPTRFGVNVAISVTSKGLRVEDLDLNCREVRSEIRILANDVIVYWYPGRHVEYKEKKDVSYEFSIKSTNDTWKVTFDYTGPNKHPVLSNEPTQIFKDGCIDFLIWLKEQQEEGKVDTVRNVRLNAPWIYEKYFGRGKFGATISILVRSTSEEQVPIDIFTPESWNLLEELGKTANVAPAEEGAEYASDKIFCTEARVFKDTTVSCQLQYTGPNMNYFTEGPGVAPFVAEPSKGDGSSNSDSKGEEEVGSA